MTVQQRLLDRLRQDPEFRRLWARRGLPGDPLPDGSRLERTHVGRNMRSAGAWSWFAVGPAGELYPVGSHASMTSLVQAKHIHVSLDASRSSGNNDIEIDPVREAR
jgi:hypothetical protein